MPNVLNLRLYDRLMRHFAAHGGVRVENHGQKARMITRRAAGGKSHVDAKYGEQYCVCCPECADRRHRLYISYMFGCPHPVTGRPMWHLAHCFNEECSTDHLKMLVRDMPLPALPPRAARVAEAETMAPPKAAPSPGGFVYVDRLGDDHAAVRYLAGRGFDKDELGRTYGVAYCTTSQYSLARERIIFFAWDRVDASGELKAVGWQARMVGEPLDKSIPKVWTCPGIERNKILFNVTNAEKRPVVVLVEGPLDSIRIGLSGVATWGKTVSDYQIHWLNKRCGASILAYLPDPDVSLALRAETLGRIRRGFSGKVVLVDGLKNDPGSTPREEIWTRIQYVIRCQLGQTIPIEAELK